MDNLEILKSFDRLSLQIVKLTRVIEKLSQFVEELDERIDKLERPDPPPAPGASELRMYKCGQCEISYIPMDKDQLCPNCKDPVLLPGHGN